MDETNTYPHVSERIKAAFTDVFVIVFLLYITSLVFSEIEYVSGQVRMIVFAVIYGLYDPICTSVFGGTVGHYIFGIRVKQGKNEKKNIILPLAIIRFIVKHGLGWLSLVFVGQNRRRQAIHDNIVNSVVIYNKIPKS